ncbi:hypothetical protein BKA56DRAFT_617014 [Ilyonectria sp. MPI-CAGE-AT-0026]|nr:hypothetical protein BKA56DRAFT_617014 [Ilyonectria sp. MPI-CAGE-AT-0026]
MSASKLLALAALLLAASPAVARTDIAGCTSSAGVATASNGGGLYATVIWYVPDTGELCEFLDCGGGRAPPKTTVPGCPAYEGTETYSPQYLDLKTNEAASAATQLLAEASGTAAEDDTATITEAPSTTKAAGTKDKTTLSTNVVESDGEQTKMTAAPESSSAASASGSSSAETTPANISSTAGAASMPTAGAIMGLMAGAAVYAGLL